MSKRYIVWAKIEIHDTETGEIKHIREQETNLFCEDTSLEKVAAGISNLVEEDPIDVEARIREAIDNEDYR